jgi:replicative DNA helicase
LSFFKEAQAMISTMHESQKKAYVTGTEVLDQWQADYFQKAPTFYPVGDGSLGRFEVGPGLINLIGGGPGVGKTALTMQMIVDALRVDSVLRACVCNVETSPTDLLERQVARLSGIDLTTIRRREVSSEHEDRQQTAINTLKPVLNRLAFVQAPFTLTNVKAQVESFKANIVVLDYIQRIPPDASLGDSRMLMNAGMNYLRRLADNGLAVIVVSAVGRTRDSSGCSSYVDQNLNLASFRESSELEYGADNAFVLATDGSVAGDVVTVKLRHLKARFSQPEDIDLHFHRPYQQFSSVE